MMQTLVSRKLISGPNENCALAVIVLSNRGNKITMFSPCLAIPLPYSCVRAGPCAHLRVSLVGRSFYLRLRVMRLLVFAYGFDDRAKFFCSACTAHASGNVGVDAESSVKVSIFVDDHGGIRCVPVAH